MQSLSPPEMLVYAAAFALTIKELDGERYEIQIPKAVKAAYNAVDSLRAAHDTCRRANVKYQEEKIAYNEQIARNLERPGNPKFTTFTTAETEVRHFELLEAFRDNRGA